MPTRQLNLMLMASGRGSDADAIMKAHYAGQIPEVAQIVLVSTATGAGCLEKATALGYPSVVVKPRTNPLMSQSDQWAFLDGLSKVVTTHHCDLVFLVGCNVIVPIDSRFSLLGNQVPMYNIHPADLELHGGRGMHGLHVHTHVLSRFVDLIKRGQMSELCDRFFTYPTVHEVMARPDAGPPLLRGAVEIPSRIFGRLHAGKLTLDEAAQELQNLVLPYEWLMLPAAVRMAATRILGHEN